MNIKKAYYYLFYKLYYFLSEFSDDAFNEYKPLLVICVLEGWLSIESLTWYTILIPNSIHIPIPIIYLLAFGVLTLNYYFFLSKNKWRSYVTEFKEFDKKHKYRGDVAVFCLILFIFCSLVFTFYILFNTPLKKPKNTNCDNYKESVWNAKPDQKVRYDSTCTVFFEGLSQDSLIMEMYEFEKDNEKFKKNNSVILIPKSYQLNNNGESIKLKFRFPKEDNCLEIVLKPNYSFCYIRKNINQEEWAIEYSNYKREPEDK